ncbi:MAG: trimethylamine methyltransferase family protein [Deltaproteobacteria bacterium]|nr:trimethylamine methyltransferase family protein [Deltaproteobacteria bacterium]
MTLRPSLKLLPAEDVERIVGEACRVLETAGVLVENADARELLLAAGASEADGRLRLPERLTRTSLESVPSRVQVFDREGKLALDLGGDNVHFDPGSSAIHIFDAERGRHRDVTSQDLIAVARLVDGLPGYAAQSTSLVPGDAPAELGDRYRLCLALIHGRKPVVTGTFVKDGFAVMHAMLSAVRGGEGALREKPLAIFDCCPSPPLRWSDLTCQALMDCARARIPAELVSVPMTGATSPVTLREAVVQHCAENLSGIVIHQLAGRGSPVIYGGSPAAFDMRQGTTPMGAIETMMIDVAYAQVGKHLGLPIHAYMALSDSKCPDYQAGFETGMGAVLAALAGINMVSGPGMLDFENCQSFEKLLLDHDACTAALRLVRGLETRPGDAVALIGEVVKAQEFLSHPHTRKHWRQELMIPSTLVERRTYGDWEGDGALYAHQRAQAEVKKRLAAPPSSPLPEEAFRALEELMRAETRRVGASPLPL